MTFYANLITFHCQVIVGRCNWKYFFFLAQVFFPCHWKVSNFFRSIATKRSRSWYDSDAACDMCFPGYSKTCMPTVRQIVDCLVAARPMPIRCGSCLTAKNNLNHATTNSCKNNVSNNSVVIEKLENENARLFNNLKNFDTNENTTSHRISQ